MIIKIAPFFWNITAMCFFKLGRKTDAMKYWIKAKENTKEGETTESLQEKIRTGILHE